MEINFIHSITLYFQTFQKIPNYTDITKTLTQISNLHNNRYTQYTLYYDDQK